MSIVTTQAWRQYNSGVYHLRRWTAFCRCDLKSTEYVARIM